MSPSRSRSAVAGPRLCSDTENALARAFALAYLLVADAHEAEAAVTEAAVRWNSETDSKQALIRSSALTAARRIRHDHRAPEASRLPRELALIAGFDTQSRGCFVLRMLMRLPLPVCAEMLGITAEQAEESLCAMLRELPERLEIEQEN